jgi:acetate kinase
MKILVINGGSSSLKYQLIDMDGEKLLAKGQCEKIGMEGSFIKQTVGDDKIEEFHDLPNHKVALDLVFEKLLSKDHGAIKSLDEIDAIGHRVLHGGEVFTHSVKVDDEVLKELDKLVPFGPLHMPANISGIRACMAKLPNVPNVAVFDTAFHSTMTKEAFLYAIPYSCYTDWKLRRYGFHGTSHKYVSKEAALFLHKDIKDLKLITCHLGNGSSIAAIKGGVCIDTSMGFTPLEGLMMGTRSGDIDPAILGVVAEKTGMNTAELITWLNKKCGLLGITGKSSDMRDLCENLGKDEKADLAMNMLAHMVKKYIGAYVAELDGVDAIIFTGGIGENTPQLREKVMANMDYIGAKIDNDINYNCPRNADVDLSSKDSKVKILRLPTNEEIEIARETQKLAK